jgi:hypothetical protein
MTWTGKGSEERSHKNTKVSREVRGLRYDALSKDEEVRQAAIKKLTEMGIKGYDKL